MIKVLGTVRPRALVILAAAANAAAQLGLTIDIVATSGNDGRHMDGSKHYTGDALDLRTKDPPHGRREARLAGRHPGPARSELPSHPRGRRRAERASALRIRRPEEAVTPNREALAWAAGFFDGEGHVHFSIGQRKTRTDGRIAYSSLHCNVTQIERGSLERFQKAVGGVGRIHGRYLNKGPNRRPHWRFFASNFPEVQAVAAMLRPWLGPVKREQFRLALRAFIERPRGKVGRKPRVQVEPDARGRASVLKSRG